MERQTDAVLSAAKRAFRHALFLLSAPVCISCGELLDESDLAFCKSCLLQYNEHKLKNCSLCAKPLHRCTCTQKLLEEHRVHRLIKVYRYVPGEDKIPSNDLLYALKRRNRRDVFEFLTAEICDAVRAALPDLSEYRMTFVPRRRAGVRRFGYDHAEVLAKAAAKELGIPFSETLRSLARSAQKKMTVSERVRNAQYRFRKPEEPIAGKWLLLDDIVTSGASMGASARELLQNGASSVVGVAVSIAYRDQEAFRHKNDRMQ